MAVFNEFDTLRRQMNRMLGDFGTSIGGGRQAGFGGGLWDDGDVFGEYVPLLMSGVSAPLVGGWNDRPLIGGKIAEEQKMEDVGQKEQGGQLQPAAQSGVGTQLQTFQPQAVLRARVNVEEQKDKYLVTADMPGFDKANIHVNVSGDGLLHLKGEQTREWSEQSKDKSYLRAERSFANIERKLRVPRGVDAEKIAANYENGVLHIVLPKTVEAAKEQKDIAIQ
jgi:HSP20 family molecular chaperone IbpA